MMKKLLVSITSAFLLTTGSIAASELSEQELKVAANCWIAVSAFVDEGHYIVEPVKPRATIGRDGRHAAGMIIGYQDKDGGMRRTIPAYCIVKDSGEVEKLQLGAFIVFE